MKKVLLLMFVICLLVSGNLFMLSIKSYYYFGKSINWDMLGISIGALVAIGVTFYLILGDSVKNKHKEQPKDISDRPKQVSQYQSRLEEIARKHRKNITNEADKR